MRYLVILAVLADCVQVQASEALPDDPMLIWMQTEALNVLPASATDFVIRSLALGVLLAGVVFLNFYKRTVKPPRQ